MATIRAVPMNSTNLIYVHNMFQLLYDSVEIGRFWNLQRWKYANHNGAKMIDLWNVNKLTEAWTKTEVGGLRTRVAQ